MGSRHAGVLVELSHEARRSDSRVEWQSVARFVAEGVDQLLQSPNGRVKAVSLQEPRQGKHLQDGGIQVPKS